MLFRSGVELHVEALVAGGDPGVADDDGHGSYDTTCSTKESGLARSPLSFEHGFWTPIQWRVADGVSGVLNRSLLVSYGCRPYRRLQAAGYGMPSPVL